MRNAAAPSPPAGAPEWASAIMADITDWVRVMLRGASQIKPYLITELPSATEWAGTTLPVSNGASGMPTVTAINGTWVYPDGTTV